VVAFALRTVNALSANANTSINVDVGAEKTFYLMEMLLSRYTIHGHENPYDLRGLFSPGLRRLRGECSVVY
jgi:hypothetical protein